MITFMLLNSFKLPFETDHGSEFEYMTKVKNDPIDFGVILSEKGGFIRSIICAGAPQK